MMIRAAALLALFSMRCTACEVVLDVPEVVSISTWEASALAHGEASGVPLDARITAQACTALALGVGYVGELPAAVRSSPNGAWLGLDPGDPARLLALPATLDLGVNLQPVLAWPNRPQGWPAGAAMGSLRWRVYARDGLLERLILERHSQVIAQVPAVLAVQIQGPQGRSALGTAPAVLDLGRLESGAVHALLIELRGNSDARVSIQARHGELRALGRRSYSIPYNLRLDGQAVGGDVALSSPLRNGGITFAQLELKVGDVERRAAGDYEEVLTLTVAAE